MPTEKLTTRRIDAVKPPAEGRLELWDTSVGGLGLRVTPRGTRTWMIRYRTASGIQRREKLGRHPDLSLADAREVASEIKKRVAKGGDPAGEKQRARKAETFKELADLYIEKYARPNKRSWQKDLGYLEREFVPILGHQRASEITRNDVRNILQSIKDRGAGHAANRAHAVIRTMFTWAIDSGTLPDTFHNPARGIRQVAKERPRDRVLTPTELREVWKAIEAEPPQYRAAFKLRLLTGARGGEIRVMRGDQISREIDGLWWTVPAEVSKNGLSHRVPLSRMAVEAILEATGADDIDTISDGHIFANPKTGRPMVALWRPVERLRTRSRADFRSHDLRRTAASHLTSMGIPRLTVSKVLGHAEAGITHVYDRHSYDREKREALEQWSERLAVIIAGEAGQIVELHG